MKNLKRNVNGITLIALVVSIIILLILAGVSIGMITGHDGIIAQAQKAKEKTEEAQKDELKEIAMIEEMASGKGTDVEKVIDKNPGILEDEEGGAKVINSIEDLVFFAHSVTNGNTYEGQTVKLGLSLDFNSSKSYVDPFRTDYGKYGYNGELKKLLNESGFISIGSRERLEDEEKSEKSFHGIFDGEGNIIYNLKIKRGISELRGFPDLGMFAANYGIIQNLGVEKADVVIEYLDDKLWAYNGILAGTNSPEGEINRCHTTGVINVGSVYKGDVGGITGSTGAGSLSDSYSDVDILIDRQISDYDVIVGLIAGSCNEGGSIDNVYSRGTVFTGSGGRSRTRTSCWGNL